MNDVSAWNECVDNSRAQLEHQALRSLLTLLCMIQFHMCQMSIYMSYHFVSGHFEMKYPENNMSHFLT